MPFFRRAKETGQLGVLFSEDCRVWNPALHYEFADEPDKAVQLGTTGHGTPTPLVALSAPRTLLLFLRPSCQPELTDCRLDTPPQVIHSARLSGLMTFTFTLPNRPPG